MKYSEEIKDLFSVDKDYILAHCISADFALGAGIAVKFRDMGVKSLLKQWLPNYVAEWNQGECLNLHNIGSNHYTVCNLVTKQRYWHKPTYKTLKESLISMRDYVDSRQEFENEPIKIAIPMIGCGLDGLSWNMVSGIIKEVFKDTPTEILVCRLK